MELHAENRARLVSAFTAADAHVPASAVILLKGGESRNIDDSDIEYVFKQESFFQWAFGVNEPDCYGLLDMRGRATLFIPKLDPSYAVWMGRIAPPAEWRARYAVDDVQFVPDIPTVIKALDPEVSESDTRH
jgi:Xaa-Pro dipeptidase